MTSSRRKPTSRKSQAEQSKRKAAQRDLLLRGIGEELVGDREAAGKRTGGGEVQRFQWFEQGLVVTDSGAALQLVGVGDEAIAQDFP